MSATTNSVLVYNDGIFSRLAGDSLFTVDVETLKSLNNYALIIDDDYFFYETLDISISNKRKMNDIIKNYLQVSYPEEMIQHFRAIPLNSSILIAIPSKAILTFFEENVLLLRNVKKISTPFIELATRNDAFVYKTSDGDLVLSDGMIGFDRSIVGDLDVFTKDDALLKIDSVNTDLQLAEKQTGLGWLGAFKIPVIILVVTYILFFAGEILRIQKVNGENGLANDFLNKQYMKAGVSGKPDPYGLLLFKAKGNKTAGKVKLTPLLDKLGKAKGEALINSLNYKNGFLRFDGSINDFTVLETFKRSLESEFNATVVVTDTKKTDDRVNFSIRIEL